MTSGSIEQYRQNKPATVGLFYDYPVCLFLVSYMCITRKPCEAESRNKTMTTCLSVLPERREIEYSH